MGVKTTTGWAEEDRQSDYVLYAKESGNLAIVIVMVTENKTVELYAEAVKQDGTVEGTDKVSMSWETALHVLGVTEDELERRDA